MSEAAKLVYPYVTLGDSAPVEPFWLKPELFAKIEKVVPRPKGSENMPGDVLLGIKDEIAKNANVKLLVEACVRCGACLNACPTYLSTQDVRNSPVGRAEMVRKALRAETLYGKVFGKWARAEKLDEAAVRKMATFYYQCLECRRCGEICPFGLDQADLTRSVRKVLYDRAGIISRYIGTVIEASERTGNNLGLPPPAI